MSKLRWSASARGWIGEKDGITVLVSEKTYNERLRTYLASKGIEMKTWMEYMRPAEEAMRGRGSLSSGPGSLAQLY